MISFLLWILGKKKFFHFKKNSNHQKIGFLIFVLTLKRGYYRYQFQQFGWTHITLLIIVGQSSALINNIYEGLVW